MECCGFHRPVTGSCPQGTTVSKCVSLPCVDHSNPQMFARILRHIQRTSHYNVGLTTGSAGGKQRSSLGQTRSSFGQGRQSFGTLRTSFGGRPVKRAVSTSSASSRGTPGKGRDSVALHRPRRSSGLGHSSSQPLKDPRNLKNEQFKRAAIEKLLQVS